MQIRALGSFLALSLTLFIPACSGSHANRGDVGTCGTQTGVNLFCLSSCNLGCSLSGCNINRIHQNEPIELVFNQDVDKFSVPPYSTSILLRTAAGEEPVGDWLVNGNRVTFVPGVLISGAKTFFGFRPNETYTLFMPSGDQEKDVVQSMGGDRLTTPITCTLNIGAIKDLNEAPPSAELVTPADPESAELDTLIRIEFNEIIDPAIFVGITPETSPIQYRVKAAQIENGEVVCRSSSEAILLPGEPRMSIDPVRSISVVTFKPKEPLPGKKCIEIAVLSQVRDLAGVVAKPHVLSFTTKDVGVRLFKNVEDFTNSQFLDKELSAGTWGNGSLTFSPIGGTGKHGVFDPSLGEDISDPKVKVERYLWDLDKSGGIKIPKTYTTTGKDEYVTDGRFEFSTVEVPDGVEVYFVGSIPARIKVRGSVRIGGLFCANGESIPTGGRPGSGIATSGKGAAKGEKGGYAGCFGGAGGDGADRGDGLGHKTAFDGKPGEAVRLYHKSATERHFYEGRWTGSGGQGSPQFPTSGLNKDILFSFYDVISQHSNRGGGGGGFTSAGGTGYVIWEKPYEGNQKYAAPGSTPGGKGASFPVGFPNYTNGYTHTDHYCIGGSGGGGGGSSTGGAIKSTPSDRWRVGRAGGGGGGAIALRIGGNLSLLVSGRLQCEGGMGSIDQSNYDVRGKMTPGGGGSGGSLFLQVNQSTQNSGSISVAGGGGGRTIGTAADPIFPGMKSYGGDGSDGILNFETTQDPQSYNVGSTVPSSPPVALLDPNDTDPLVTIRSLWYGASLLFPPEFRRYEIEALIDGIPVTFSDDPSKGVLATTGQPVRFAIQGAKLELDPSGKLAPIANTAIKPFREYVGPFGQHNEPALFDDGATGYRFELTLDRSLGKKVEVKKITVFWAL